MLIRLFIFLDNLLRISEVILLDYQMFVSLIQCLCNRRFQNNDKVETALR